MRILITGATGFVGKKLVETLFVEKNISNVAILTRSRKEAQRSIPFPVDIFEWDPDKGFIEPNALSDVDVVIHLAGENIADGRWDKLRKRQIIDSRVNSTKLLMLEIKKLKRPPLKFISASAVGYYGNSGDANIDETSEAGHDFLAEVCSRWENELFSEKIEHMNCHVLRFGIVLDSTGGALTKMLPPFLMGIGGRLGQGDQFMSWIHIDDLVDQLIFLIENEGKYKIYNATAPVPVTNNTFTKILGEVLARPTIFPVPGIVLKLALGEMSLMLLTGQKVLPNHFLSEGFKFKFPDLKLALENIFYYRKTNEFKFKTIQWINHPLNYSFQFFSDEKNLEKLTPDYLQFKVLGKSTPKIATGTLIDYKLKLRGVPMYWQTKINKFEPNDFFIDEQLKGPYKKWVHKHQFISCKGGTLIKDEVVYQLPLGLLGRYLLAPFVKKDIGQIFKYRQNFLKNNF